MTAFKDDALNPHNRSGMSTKVRQAHSARQDELNSPIVHFALKWLSPLLVTLALFLFWRGHHEPGGGFAAGLVLGLVVVIECKMGVKNRRMRILADHPSRWLVVGLAIAGLSGVPGMIAGGPFLDPIWFKIPGGIKLGTPLFFDLGVMIVVAGVIVTAALPLLLTPKQLQESEE